MDIITEWVGVSVQAAALSLLFSLAEALLPKGKLKNAAETGLGLLFLSAMVQKICGIFDRMGV